MMHPVFRLWLVLVGYVALITLWVLIVQQLSLRGQGLLDLIIFSAGFFALLWIVGKVRKRVRKVR